MWGHTIYCICWYMYTILSWERGKAELDTNVWLNRRTGWDHQEFIHFEISLRQLGIISTVMVGKTMWVVNWAKGRWCILSRKGEQAPILAAPQWTRSDVWTFFLVVPLWMITVWGRTQTRVALYPRWLQQWLCWCFTNVSTHTLMSVNYNTTVYFWTRNSCCPLNLCHCFDPLHLKSWMIYSTSYHYASLPQMTGTWNSEG